MKRALAVGVRSFSSGAARPFYFSYLGVQNSFSHLAFQSQADLRRPSAQGDSSSVVRELPQLRSRCVHPCTMR